MREHVSLLIPDALNKELFINLRPNILMISSHKIYTGCPRGQSSLPWWIVQGAKC